MFKWTDIVFDIESQLHVLKHFSAIDDAYKENLLENENISANEIEHSLSFMGSKFFTSFVLNPLLLFNWLVENIPQKDLKIIKGRCEIHFKTYKDHFPIGIGYDNLICIKNIANGDKSELKYEQRGDFNIFSIQKGIKVPTWQINCIIVNENGKINIKTIFPGIMAPPFPDKTYQTEKEFKKNIAFWSKYAFLK